MHIGIIKNVLICINIARFLFSLKFQNENNKTICLLCVVESPEAESVLTLLIILTEHAWNLFWVSSLAVTVL